MALGGWDVFRLDLIGRRVSGFLISSRGCGCPLCACILSAAQSLMAIGLS
jgi:hypothetical protein